MEHMYKYTAKVIENKRCHLVQQNVQNQAINTQIYPHQGQRRRQQQHEARV
jgi:hypothetical protein